MPEENKILPVNADTFYKSCTQCPRNCSCNRQISTAGFCHESQQVRIASACLHFGEEPLVTVHGGSGAIFFTGCTLHCAFCQNYQIAQQGMGQAVSMEDFVEICRKLQDAGAENINLITASHIIPQLAQYLKAARNSGITIPFCWNSSGYEKVEMLELLKGLVTIWLPDFKTLSSSLAKQLFAAENYPDTAKKAVSWMIKNSPMEITEVNKNGIIKEKMLSGVIIRHLFLPGRFEETAETLGWLKENADSKACISLMSQYTPVPFKGSQKELEQRKKALNSIENRLVSQSEEQDLQDLIEAYDFEYLFYQELTSDTDWLPDFSRVQPFSNKLAKPVWHWKDGFCKKFNIQIK